MSPTNTLLDSRRTLTLWLPRLALAAVLTTILCQAWIGEDAHITMRTVDNFVNGRGLRWNLDERVQSYTHPLWLLLVSMVYALTGEIPWTLTAISLLCSGAAFGLLLARRRDAGIASVIMVSLLFIGCGPLTRFSTSGFESPLTALILVSFAMSFIDRADLEEPAWGRLCLLAALAAMTRHDTLLIVGPALLYLAWGRWRSVPWKRCVLGFSPFLLWTAFSLTYYGFIFPNTAPGKLSGAVPTAWYVRRGLRDLASLMGDEPAAAAILSLALIGSAWAAWRHFRGVRAREPQAPSSMGALAVLGGSVLLYGVYIIRIGGGFILGRFWIAPLWLCLVILIRLWPSVRAALFCVAPRRRFALASMLLLLPLALNVWASRAMADVGPKGRPRLLRSLAHLRLQSDLQFAPTAAATYLIGIGELARQRAEASPGYAETIPTIGFAGVAAGPDVTIVDPLGLGDALLARLKPRNGNVGHLLRKVPLGYLEFRTTGSMGGLDPNVRRYLSKLRLITSGPLFSANRWSAILGMHLGRYDHWLESFEGDVQPDMID